MMAMMMMMMNDDGDSLSAISLVCNSFLTAVFI
jgi:hypothetical protein